jgi:phosphomannomutase/phosphoglucomutase
MVEPKIFRQYDIRGVWGQDLTKEAVRAIGKAFVVYLKEKVGGESLTASIGRDVRMSSPEILEILTEAFTSSGVNVVDVGMCPTPLQYFSLHQLDLQGGIMITGSHNPPEYNGLKLSAGKDTLHGEEIQEIRKLVEEGRTMEGSGTSRIYPIVHEYTGYMLDRFESMEGIRVVVDSGNGTGGVVAPHIMRALGAEVIELYSEPDGNFPNHHPDPVVLENLKDLIAKVKETGAHAGIGFDGDADRIGVIDEDGDVIWGDRLMIIFARDILRENPGATVIGEVKCSQTLYDDIKAHGGNPIMWKTGHSLIKKKMKDEGALLAGEMSGHLFFTHRYLGFDDAVYAGLRLLEIMKRSGEPYSVKKLLEGVPEMVSTPEIRIDCPDEVKFTVAEKMKEAFKDYPVVDIDGVRINFPEGWGLLRASNTQPALVMRFEAKDEESLKKIKETVEGELEKLV